MADTREIHNRLAPKIVAAIVKPPLAAGGDVTDILVVLESVIVGVILFASKLGGDNITADTIMEGVKLRLAEQRLGDRPTAGSA